MKYLSLDGLNLLWNKIKNYIQSFTYSKDESDTKFLSAKLSNLYIDNEDDGFNIINLNNRKAGIRFLYKNERLGFFGYDTRHDITLYSQATNSRISFNSETGHLCWNEYDLIQQITDLQTKVKTLEEKLNSIQNN